MVSARIIRNATIRLNDTNYDVAAGLSEATLNDFLQAHWKAEEATQTSVYKGSGRSDELAISWSYHVTAPAVISLAPLTAARFAPIYRNWLRTVPEVSRHLVDPRLPSPPPKPGIIGDAPPPNVQVSASAIHVELKTDTGIDVGLDVSMVITGFVETTNDSGNRVLRITPIDARITNQGTIQSELRRLLGMHKLDDPNCVALEKLILYIVNVVLANRIGSFVREFGLPVPIKLVNNLTLGDLTVLIVEKHIVLLAHLGSEVSVARIAPELEQLREPDSEILRALAARKSTSVNQYALPQNQILRTQVISPAADWPSRGIFIILHQRFFQALVSTMGVDQRQDKCEGWAIFKICWGYFLKLWGLVATVVDTGLIVRGKFDGAGYGKACIETHCGDACVGLSAEAKADPTILAQFSFQSSEFWMGASPVPFPVKWEVGGLPWPFGDVVGWFLDVLTGLAEVFLAAIGYQFRTKLTTLPANFPGTNLQYTPMFDPQILKVPNLPALAVLGEIHFKA